MFHQISILYLILNSVLYFKSGMTMSVASLMKNYLSSRDQVFHLEKEYHLGQSLQLNWNELQANAYLMKHKLRELDEAMLTGEFGPAKSFYLSKEDIEDTRVFEFIKKMPKGAALHTHHISLGQWYQFRYLSISWP